jgi:hypothetical protein
LTPRALGGTARTEHGARSLKPLDSDDIAGLEALDPLNFACHYIRFREPGKPLLTQPQRCTRLLSYSIFGLKWGDMWNFRALS